MDKKFLFINNPISGRGKQDFIQLFKTYQSKFPNHTIINTTHVGHAKELAIKHQANYDVIVAVGGDGTINEIASTLIGTDIPLGIIPKGSGNGFANYMGISRDMHRSLQQLLTGTCKAIDTVLLNDKPFVNVAGVGFDGHISKLFNQSNTRGFWNYVRLSFKEFFTFKEFEYSIVSDFKLTSGKAFVIAIANTSQYGNNFKIAPNANSNDGIINIMLYRKPSLWVVPYIVWSVFKGKILGSKYCTEIKGKEITLKSANQIVHVDGEVTTLDTSSLKIEVQHNSLLVIL